MFAYWIAKIKDCPAMKEKAANWFHVKWGIPPAVYLENVKASLSVDRIQEWYLCSDGEKMIGGMGEIKNDFHDGKDLGPTSVLCTWRKHTAGKSLRGSSSTMSWKLTGIEALRRWYLITTHTGFYERYGWKFLCMAQGDSESKMSRIYIDKPGCLNRKTDSQSSSGRTGDV